MSIGTVENARRLPRGADRDHAPWRQGGGQSILTEEQGYWEELFTGFEPNPRLHVMPGKGKESPGDGLAEAEMGAERMAKWVDFSSRNGVFFESMVIAAWSIVLSRYLRTNDVAFHAIWADVPESERRQFPVRCILHGDQTIDEALQTIENQTQGSLRQMQENPLTTLPELETGILFDSSGTAGEGDFRACELGLSVEIRRGAMRLFYQRVLPSEGSALRMMGHLFRVLDQLAEKKTKRLSNVSLLTAEEWHREVHEWNETACVFPRLTLHEGFASVAARRKNAIALQSGSQVLTYEQLSAYSGRLARQLADRGAGPGERVAVVMERSFEFFVALLATLRTGAAYVPVDPDLPDERRRFILRKCGVNLALVREGGEETCPSVRRLRVDLTALTEGDAYHYPGSVEDCAYTIFTSGSTGTPKGVAVSHGSVSNEVRACIQAWDLSENDVYLQFASPSFDVSVEEIWTAWLTGGRLVMPDDAALSSFPDFGEWLRVHGVTVLNLPSAFWHSMVESMAECDSGLPSGVRLLVAGGEEVNAGVYEKWRATTPNAVGFVNAYGPTEATVTSTMFRDWCDERSFDQRVPIGRPIANTTHYVVDQFGNPQPHGVPGELWIAGVGVAIGYVDDRASTESSFRPNPYGLPGDRCYSTGDLVFADASGSLYFLGRADRQIKVRGCRIEPGEIETILREHPEVGDAYFCELRGSGTTTQLCAWVTPKGDYWPSESELRNWMAERLPSWMRPSSVVTVDRLPLNSSGKIEVAKLPTKSQMPVKTGYLKKDDERRLAAVWKEVLGASPRMREQDFFEMGGDSISVMTLAGRIRECFKVRLPVGHLYSNPQLGLMIDRIREEGRKAEEEGAIDWHSLVEIQSGGPSQSPLFLVHGIGGGILWGYRNLAQHLPKELPILAFSARGNDDLPEFETLDGMIDQYLRDLRERQPNGPYRIGGYCLGGNIAHEIACRLEAEGEQVELLLFDAYPFLGREGRLQLGSLKEWGRFGRNLFSKFRNLLAMPRGDKWRHLCRMGRWGRKWFSDRILRRNREISGDDPAKGEVGTLTDINQYTPAQLALWKHHLRLFADWINGPFEGRAHVLRTRSQPVYSVYSDDLGWSEIVRGGVDVHLLPGHHESVFLKPGIAATADAVVSALNLQPSEGDVS